MLNSFNHRVIPVLLINNKGSFNSLNFSHFTYLGDPINAVKILSEKKADEIVILDIVSSKTNSEIDFDLLYRISSQSMCPLVYGGGIKTIQQIEKILSLGFEKISLNTSLFTNPAFVKEACFHFGTSTIIASIDVKKNKANEYTVFVKSGTENTFIDPVQYALDAEKLGVGEILLNSIDNDGTMNGYDLELIESVSSVVSIPVIAFGGANSIVDFNNALTIGKASAVAASNVFVFHGKHNALLIKYPVNQSTTSI